MSDVSTVIDADAHYWEPLDEMAEYMAEPWRTKVLEHPGGISSIKKRWLPSSSGDRSMAGRIRRDETPQRSSGMSSEDIPKAMEYVGVDVAILLSQLMLASGKIVDEERIVVLANAYVDYMLETVVDPSKGIYTMLPVPYQDPDEAVALIDRVGREKGIVAACMITSGAEPPLGHRRYDRIYQAIRDAGLPVVFHGGGSGIDQFYIKGYKTFLETHTLGFLFANAAQLTSIVVQGLPEKFPELDIVFQESGVAWVPALMDRLDAEYFKRQSEAPLLSKRPSKYIQEFYFGTQPMEHPENPENLAHVIDRIGGSERLVYASDYPHWDYDRPSVINDLPFLSTAEKRQVLGGNAKEVFNL